MPRYADPRTAHTQQIIRALDKLTRPDNGYGIQITPGMTDEAVIAFVAEYARMRDREAQLL